MLLNAVANDPSVLRHIAPGFHSIDLTPFFADPRNKLFGDSDGLVIFGARGGGEYEMHYLFTRRRRGKAALQQLRYAISMMFTEHSATAICGETPRDNRAARTVNRALGGRPVGVSTDSLGRPSINYRLERASWAASSAALSGVSAAS